jgi:hypothetical protein
LILSRTAIDAAEMCWVGSAAVAVQMIERPTSKKEIIANNEITEHRIDFIDFLSCRFSSSQFAYV